MNNLFILSETFTNGFTHITLTFISSFTVLCAISTVVSRNPIVSVLFLIGLFLNVAGYLMVLGMNYIGLSYLLVYVGAVSILFLFILMLINVRVSELSLENNNSIPLAIIISGLLNFTLYNVLPNNDLSSNVKYKTNTSDLLDYTYNLFFNNDLWFVTSHNWDGTLAESSHITSIGNILYTGYPLLLILTSLVLLLAMVGAIIITIKQK